MPLTGPVVHQQLLQGYADVQARLQTLHQQDKSVAAEQESLGQDRESALSRLAEHYLPDLTEDSIRAAWSEARPALIDVLRRKGDRQQSLESDLETANAQLSEANRRVVAATEDFDTVNQAVQQLSEQVQLDLTQNVEFVRLSEAAARAEAALERAEANLDEIEQDSATKLPAYEQSDLFQYLWKRGYGTEAYSSRGFTRRTDRWLSHLIDYPKVVQSYRFLRETPATMQKIMDDDRQSLQTVMGELTRIRNEACDRIGLTTKSAEAELIAAKRSELVTEANEQRDATERIHQQLSELDDSRGPFYREAIDAFRGMLGTLGTADLESFARSTRQITDDQIVSSLSAVDVSIDQLEGRTIRYRRELQATQRLLGGLGRLIQRFRDAQYDSGRSQFLDSVDVQHRVFSARDESDLEDLWTAIRRAHRWGPTTMDRITQVATHPMTQVLVGAMAQAAGAALSQHAHRAGRRRF